MNKIFVLIGVFIFSSCSSLFVLPSRDVAGQIDPDSLWVRVNDRKDSLIRSNPAHFWAWMKLNTPEKLKSTTQWSGQVTADPHFFNFGDIHSKNQSGLALVDVDDSGKASLYFDFVRYSLFIKAYLNLDLTPKLLDSYIKGLQQQTVNTPPVLTKAMKPTSLDLLAHHQNWVLQHVDNNKKLNNKDLGLIGFKKLQLQNPEAVKLGEELREALLRDKKAQVIYDIGYKENDSGSSRGMSRFWFSLLDTNLQNRILECKELGLPATSYYEKQSPHTLRIQNVLKVYSDFNTTDSYVFNLPANSFWCRPKHFEFLDRDVIEKKMTPAELIVLAEYFAFWLGKRQSLQTDAFSLRITILENKKSVLDQTVDLIRQYENHVFNLK